MAGGAKATHECDDRVIMTKEDEAKIIFLKQQALGADWANLRLGDPCLNLGEKMSEIVQKLQLESFFRQ